MGFNDCQILELLYISRLCFIDDNNTLPCLFKTFKPEDAWTARSKQIYKLKFNDNEAKF